MKEPSLLGVVRRAYQGETRVAFTHDVIGSNEQLIRTEFGLNV